MSHFIGQKIIQILGVREFNALRHRWQTQGPRAESGPPPCFIQLAPCFYPAAALSSHLTVKEQLHLYSPKLHLAL